MSDAVRIPVSRGIAHATIDVSDFDLVAPLRWHLKCSGRGAFGIAYAVSGNGVSMHRLILDATQGTKVDHRNGDGLDNRRGNLRTATDSQNQANRPPQAGRAFKGVARCNSAVRPWKAHITVNGKYIHLGVFATVEQAAAAYNVAALEFFGEFARLNPSIGGAA